MTSELKPITTDPPELCEGIEVFIRSCIEKMRKDGVVIGLSGGLDSAVVAMLAVRSLGKEKVHLINMPERDSNPVHRAHARQYAEFLGIELKVIDLSRILRSTKTYALLPLGFIPGRKLRGSLVDFSRRKFIRGDGEKMLADRFRIEPGSWFAKGNTYGMMKHRLRMCLVYQYAELNNHVVVGCANRTEYLTGTFCKWGIDHCADIMPVLHLFRSQIEVLGKFLGIPGYILTQKSDPDLYPIEIDKGNFMGGYEAADSIIFNLTSGVLKTTLMKYYNHDLVNEIEALMSLSEPMRLSPYHITM